MDPQFSSNAYANVFPQAHNLYDEPTSSLPVGTLLHKGFYDLLAMIPTPSPSRLIWGTSRPAPVAADPIVAGPRYENISSSPTKPIPPAAYSKKGRRISKDMVSKPTGFVHLVHASDAEQLEALLTRWGPDGLGKLGDPRWANPIKNQVRQTNQERAFNEVLKSSTPLRNEGYEEFPRGELRVVNGMSSTTTTSSLLTTAAGENVVGPSFLDGLPGRPGNSTIRWGGGLKAHPEVPETEGDPVPANLDLPQSTPAPRAIIPSLATLDRAVSARIYFENLYFPLFRQPPSREQRRLAMEKDMMDMNLSQAQKEHLRARWRQNETDYLRERRRKVDASAFVKLKTIGHGAFGVVSLVKEQSTGNLYAMKQLRKIDMLRKGQEGHVRAERDVLKSASMVNSPTGAEWIVRLYYSFQDRDHLYLVLEYMGGGDLLNLLIERDVFDEDFTRFYVAEAGFASLSVLSSQLHFVTTRQMLLAIESCHKHGFIHRDIKPDVGCYDTDHRVTVNFHCFEPQNFLFDPQGHIKLSDFGLATDLHWAHDTSYYEQQRLHLLRKHGIDLEDGNGISDGKGTRRMNRQDVELLMGNGEGKEGIFTWREKNRRKRHVTRQKILNWKQSLRFPSRPRVSHDGVGLIQQLLCEPEDRLGSQPMSRPNSIVMQSKRSSFISPNGSIWGNDGAELIKACIR
ncbi:hypothetical protein C0991_011391 [Blastosporella zonata]|nr:hypothetical protein C0991_011391 [Blastosporella zonata]